MDNSLYAFYLKPYDIVDEDGNKCTVTGDIYISRMPVDDPIDAAWFSDGEHCGSCVLTPDMLKTDIERVVRIG